MTPALQTIERLMQAAQLVMELDVELSGALGQIRDQATQIERLGAELRTAQNQIYAIRGCVADEDGQFIPDLDCADVVDRICAILKEDDRP